MWAVEWVAVPQALILTGGVAAKLAWVLAGLELDTARMRANLDVTRGAIMAEAVMMAFAHRWGHEQAHRIVAEASVRAATEKLSLDAALSLDPMVAAAYDPAALSALVGDPASYLGTARVVATDAAS
jgi:3-carboxy-cis,cis-muconate cycloisomerase